jgi:hypothetical protein
MVEKGNTKLFVRKILPKVFKAAFLAVITYLPMYFLSSLINPIKPFFPWYEPVTNIFAAVFIFFLVAGVFFSGTVFQYIFSVARTLVLMIFFICVLNGGIITLTVPTEGAPVNIILDLTVVLAMLVLVCLLGIAKNVVQAIDFVSSKAETEEM